MVHSFKWYAILSEESSRGHPFLQTHRVLCNIRWSHPLFCFLVIKSFKSYVEQIIFNSSCYSEQALLLKELLRTSNFLKVVYSSCSHPSFEVSYLFFSRKVWHSFILWTKLFYFSHPLILLDVVCLFPKQVAGMSYFSRAVYFSDVNSLCCL